MADEIKHTPGPWTYAPWTRSGEFAVHQADGARYTRHSSDVATVRGATGDPPEIAEANARLIAAAPDMYEALETQEKAERLASKVGRTEETEIMFDVAQSLRENALRKARGEADE